MSYSTAEDASGASADRVRRSTPQHINERIDREAEERVDMLSHQNPRAIEQRIAQLDQEWDVERILEVNASTLALTGLVLGITVNRRWLLLPGLVRRSSCSTAWKVGVLLCRSCAGSAYERGAKSIVKSMHCGVPWRDRMLERSD